MPGWFNICKKTLGPTTQQWFTNLQGIATIADSSRKGNGGSTGWDGEMREWWVEVVLTLTPPQEDSRRPTKKSRSRARSFTSVRYYTPTALEFCYKMTNNQNAGDTPNKVEDQNLVRWARIKKIRAARPMQGDGRVRKKSHDPELPQ